MVLFQKMFMSKQNKLTALQQLQFLKRLERLLDHGYSLLNALELIKWYKPFIHSVDLIVDELINGKYVDEAFERAGFHPTIISYFYFIRINGDLLTSIEKCIDMFEHRIKTMETFKRVIRYPIFLSFLFVLLLIFLKTSVLPSFMDIFQSSSESTTSLLLSIMMIDLISTMVISACFVSFFGWIFWNIYKKRVPVEQQINLYKKLPIYRSAIRLQTSYYFAIHMGMFLKTGMSLKDVIFHMQEQQKIPVIAYYAELMMEELKKGIYIDGLMEQLYFIENQLAVIFQKHHNLDHLQRDVTSYAEFLTETIEQKVKKVMAMIQPIFFAVLACFIIFTYMTLMWPMFQFIQSV